MSTKPEDLAGKKPAAKSAGKGFSAWLKTHQKQAFLGAAGLGVVVIALVSKKKAAAASSTTSTAVPAIDPSTGVPYSTELAEAQDAATTTVPQGTYYGSSGEGGGYGDELGTSIDQLDSQLSALSAQLQGSTSATTPPADVNPGGPLLSAGSGVTPVALPQEFITSAGIPVYTSSGSGPPNQLSTNPGQASRFTVGPSGVPELIPGSGG
jgi:hypothetical protein